MSTASAQGETPRTRTRRGEVISDLYIGAAITTDATVELDGFVQEESLLCGAADAGLDARIGIRLGEKTRKAPESAGGLHPCA